MLFAARSVFGSRPHGRNTGTELAAPRIPPPVAVMADAGAAEELAGLLADCPDIDVLSGEQGLIDVAAAEQADTVMASIVGLPGWRRRSGGARWQARVAGQ